jgi:hypothetical protein
MSMPTLKRAATMRPLTVKSRLHRETSNHSNLDSLLEDISCSQQHKENRCRQAAQQLIESQGSLLQLIHKGSGLTQCLVNVQGAHKLCRPAQSRRERQQCSLCQVGEVAIYCRQWQCRIDGMVM